MFGQSASQVYKSHVAQRFDIEAMRGDTFNVTFDVTLNAQHYDLTNYVDILCQIKSNPTNDNADVTCNASLSTITVDSVEYTYLTIQKDYSSMMLKKGKYYYDIQIINANEELETWLFGTIKILQDVSNYYLYDKDFVTFTYNSGYTISNAIKDLRYIFTYNHDSLKVTEGSTSQENFLIDNREFFNYKSSITIKNDIIAPIQITFNYLNNNIETNKLVYNNELLSYSSSIAIKSEIITNIESKFNYLSNENIKNIITTSIESLFNYQNIDIITNTIYPQLLETFSYVNSETITNMVSPKI
jgi:hypothetical protein